MVGMFFRVPFFLTVSFSFFLESKRGRHPSGHNNEL